MFQLFVIYDSKIPVYEELVQFRSAPEAIRGLSDLISSQKEHKYAKHPEDFTLFQIAEWDNQTGVLAALPTPVSVCRLIDIVSLSDDHRAPRMSDVA
ncbi:MAG: nonstructural protein [Microviridae sp.]|nr:MAG: nonstructural protein [Microviridae sp.]